MKLGSFWAKHLLRVAATLLFLCSLAAGRAVIFFSTADPDHNTLPPTGDLAQSGWALEGLWGGFLGTPIAPSFFITAAHVGGTIGNPFVFDGQTFTTTAFFDDPNSDLRIWQVNGTFPRYAALYAGSDEVGKELVVIGRGTQRGEPIVTSGVLGGELKGWRWGAPDGRERWGRNQVSSIATSDGVQSLLGSTGKPSAQLLRAAFDRVGLPDEAHLSAGDSGGAVFMMEAGTWKLAGINFAVDGPYNDSTSGPGFNAVLVDEGGLYKQNATGVWVLTPDLPGDTPNAFYATRISSRQAWVQSIIASSLTVVQFSSDPSGPYADLTSAHADSGAKTVTIPRPQGRTFYRLRSNNVTRITSIRIADANLVISYE